MEYLANPIKTFNFIVEVNGVDQFTVQKITLPEITIDQVEHGNMNYKSKTPGQTMVGNLTLEMLRQLPNADIKIWEWMQSANSQLLDGGLLAEAYKKIIIIKEMDPTGLATINSHICNGCWPSKITQGDFDRMSSDNLIITAEFSVDSYHQIKS